MQTPKAAAILTIVAMHIEKRLGPSTEPYGTPTDNDEDVTVDCPYMHGSHIHDMHGLELTVSIELPGVQVEFEFSKIS